MKYSLLSLLAAALLSGCQTYQSPTYRASQSQDQMIAQENQRRMAGRIETLEMEIGRISRELDSLRGQIENRCAAIEVKSEQDKREMISRLTSELERLIKQATPPPSVQSSNSGGGSGYGIEHIVRPGETLSAISKAYNVSPKVIIEQNKLKNPNRLSVGQKLFIPE